MPELILLCLAVALVAVDMIIIRKEDKLQHQLNSLILSGDFNELITYTERWLYLRAIRIAIPYIFLGIIGYFYLTS